MHFESLSKNYEENARKHGIKLSNKTKKYKVKKKRHKKNKRNKLIKTNLKYKDYIKSVFWRNRKNAYFRKHGKKCTLCDSTKVGLHHLVYKDFGAEKDEHLIALCWYHHEKFHIEYGVQGNMIKNTNEYIDEQNQLNEFENILKNL